MPRRQGFPKVFWITAEGALKIFRHARVAFGVTSSSFLLGAVIDFHLKKYSEGFEETTEYNISTIGKLRKSFYVDNCVTSVENDKEFRLFVKEASLVFAEAKFDLRGWEYSDPSLENHANTVVLGLTWDRKADILAVSNLELVGVEVVTCRIMLSLGQGFLTPLVLPVPFH